MVKTIHIMHNLLQQHNLANFIPNIIKNKIKDKPPKDQGMNHILTSVVALSVILGF